MSIEEFKQFIESIGFGEITGNYYKYNDHRIDLSGDFYDYHNGYDWFLNIYYKDLRYIKKEFKKELRSIKLKKLLG